MAKSAMTGRERLLTAILHEEPDRVPISPRVGAWLTAVYGDASLSTQMEKLPDMDVMHIVGDGTPNYIDSYPDAYDLPEVQVDHGYARGMQDLMTDFYDNRTFFDDLLWLFHRRSLAQTKAALEGGAEFIFGSWYFHSLSVGWSPNLFAKVFSPQIREHVELMHAYDAYYDYYDDGRLMGSMEMIAGTGVDVLETCTPPPVGDFDLAEAKRRIGGRTTLKGYVDLLYVIKHGTPGLVERTVREAMAVAKPGGGFIIGSSDSFREGTPKENIAAYFEACKRYGVY